MGAAFAKHKPKAALLGARHVPSGLNSRFFGAGMNFTDYAAACRAMLHRAHAATSPELLERIVAGNAPFDLTPAHEAARGLHKRYRRGVLLAHGLTDSPYLMRPLGEFFRRQGFRVIAILLPGHGSRPGDLLEVRWQEWAEAFAWGVEQLAREADEIYLAGYSAGATLAVRHSTLDERVRGLFLFSPALNVPFLAAWERLHRMFGRLFRGFRSPASEWVEVKPDDDLYKYESLPKNAAVQMQGLIADTQSRLAGRAQDIPVFAAASADDATVASAATLAFMAGARHPRSKLVYYTTEPARQPRGVPEGRIELVNSVVPAQNIICFSHLSLLMPPEDAHYGLRGAYANCLHYFPDDMEKYAACHSNAPLPVQGEVTARRRRAGVMRRLTYNPHFHALESYMKQFIESLS
jgi:esterase/lipase